MNIIVENKRHFQDSGLEYVIFDRDYSLNQADIAGCAVLAMNKAIIGVCGLEALELAEDAGGIPLRSAKAIQVYYILYHLFTCCMLMDSEYELKIGKVGYQNKPFSYGMDLQQLKRRAETPSE